MESIEVFLDKGVLLLQRLEGLPAVMLVLLSCLVVGYVARVIKRFPNDAIPVLVILWGGVFTPMLQDARNTIPFRIWLVRGVFIGMVIGCAAWFVHHKLLSKIEEKLGLFGAPKDLPLPVIQKPADATPPTP